MNYAKLAAELSDDPLAVGYAGMTDKQAADSLNAVNRTRNKTTMTASEVLNAIVISEWNALTDAQCQQIWDVLHIGDINPFGVEATLFIAVFGGGSATIEALAAIRQEAISRADELGFGFIYPGHIENARY
jgi:hypothetical protein